MAFNIDTTGIFTYMEICFDLWFIFEILINFTTGFYDKGILIMNRKAICKNYIKGWFFVDAMSSFPMSLVDLFTEEQEDYSALQSAKLLRIVRITKWARLIRLIRFLKA